MLLLRSAMRQPRNGNLRQLNKNTPRLLRDALLLYKLSKAFHTECLITIISVTLFPSNKFPRLLAEREIIANALFTNDVLEMACTNSNGKGTTKY